MQRGRERWGRMQRGGRGGGGCKGEGEVGEDVKGRERWGRMLRGGRGGGGC